MLEYHSWETCLCDLDQIVTYNKDALERVTVADRYDYSKVGKQITEDVINKDFNNHKIWNIPVSFSVMHTINDAAYFSLRPHQENVWFWNYRTSCSSYKLLLHRHQDIPVAIEILSQLR